MTPLRPTKPFTAFRRTLFRSLSHRPFELYFWAYLASNTGNWMQSVAIGWLVYRLTGSPEWLALVTLASQGPFAFVAPLAGALADRSSPSRTLLVTQVISAAVSAACGIAVLSGLTDPTLVLIAALTLGVLNAIDVPTRQTLLREIVPAPDVANAVALNASMLTGSRLIGPMLAGFALTFVGEGWCILANAVSYVAVAAFLLELGPSSAPPPKAEPFARLLLAGSLHVRSSPMLSSLTVLAAVLALFGLPHQAFLPIIAADVLKGGPETLSLLHASSGAGALAGALCLASRAGVGWLVGWIATAAIVFGLALLGLAAAPSAPTAALSLALVGGAQMVQMSGAYILIQTTAPTALRGRLLALYSAVQIGFAPFGALLLSGPVASFGAPRVIAFGGLACVGAGIAFACLVHVLTAEVHAAIERNSD